MFAKVSLKSFIYEFTERFFFFPNRKTREIFEKYMIESVFPYSVLTETDSICIFFIFICKLSCSVPNEKSRDVSFEVIANNDVLNQFDTSHEFCDQFKLNNINLRKKLGYFSIEKIDRQCLVTVSVNPKKYFE